MKRSALAVALYSVSTAAASPPTCGPVADVPDVSVTFPSSAPAPLFDRAHNLLRRFSEGDGALTATDAPTLSPRNGVALYPLPWETVMGRAERVRLLTWQKREERNDENMPAIVLRAGESWCTAKLTWRRGARLRFEAFSIEARQARLSVGDVTLEPPFPSSLSASRQSDLPLEGSSGAVCFRADEAAIAIGEPRVLVPEDEGDERPRWLILTIFDALRGDVLRGPNAATTLPTLHALSASGHFYQRAISPGCHTRAAVFPIFMGRDLMRIDPLKRRQSMPIESPLDEVYARGNVFVSHLADAAGYHSVFVGNNSFIHVLPAFARYSSWGSTDAGTLDTMKRLPELFARYADERILLVYYISTPHGQSHTPRRWFDALGCGKLEGIDQCRCQYEARVRHGDEALRALEEGLDAYRLSSESVHFVTADHGELFDDGMKLEGEYPTFTTGVRRGAFQSFDRGHGHSCHFRETDVPLVVHGKGIDARRWSSPVSGLDIVPTMVELMELSPVGRLDGRVLPLVSGDDGGPRPIVSYGFCSDSVIADGAQLIWWVQGCRLRKPEDGTPVTRTTELWIDAERVESDREDLMPRMRTHEAWLRERLPPASFFFDTTNVAEARVILTASEGRITDYGPASTVFGLERIRGARLSPDGRRLTLELDDYRGLYYVTTLPSDAPIDVRIDGAPEALHFVGPMQLPLANASRPLDPRIRPRFFFADGAPIRRETDRAAVRLWWQRYRGGNIGSGGGALSDFDRVLREWGYIR